MGSRYEGLEHGLRQEEARKEVRRLAKLHSRSNEHVRREDLRHKIVRERRHLE